MLTSPILGQLTHFGQGFYSPHSWVARSVRSVGGGWGYLSGSEDGEVGNKCAMPTSSESDGGMLRG